MSSLGVIFGNMAFLSVCGELSIAFVLSWSSRKFPWTPLTNNSIRCNSFPVLETLFTAKRCSIVALASPLFVNFIYLTLYMHKESNKASTVLNFHVTSQMPFNFSCLLLYSLSNHLLASPSVFSPLCIVILFLVLSEIHSCTIPLFSIWSLWLWLEFACQWLPNT